MICFVWCFVSFMLLVMPSTSLPNAINDVMPEVILDCDNFPEDDISGTITWPSLEDFNKEERDNITRDARFSIFVRCFGENNEVIRSYYAVMDGYINPALDPVALHLKPLGSTTNSLTVSNMTSGVCSADVTIAWPSRTEDAFLSCSWKTEMNSATSSEGIVIAAVVPSIVLFVLISFALSMTTVCGIGRIITRMNRKRRDDIMKLEKALELDSLGSQYFDFVEYDRTTIFDYSEEAKMFFRKTEISNVMQSTEAELSSYSKSIGFRPIHFHAVMPSEQESIKEKLGKTPSLHSQPSVNWLTSSPYQQHSQLLAGQANCVSLPCVQSLCKSLAISNGRKSLERGSFSYQQPCNDLMSPCTPSVHPVCSIHNFPLEPLQVSDYVPHQVSLPFPSKQFPPKESQTVNNKSSINRCPYVDLPCPGPFDQHYSMKCDNLKSPSVNDIFTLNMGYCKEELSETLSPTINGSPTVPTDNFTMAKLAYIPVSMMGKEPPVLNLPLETDFQFSIM